MSQLNVTPQASPASTVLQHLNSLLAAAQQARVRQLQRLFGLRTFLSVILQTAKFALVDGERLQRLLWTQTALQRQQADRHSVEA